MGRPLQTDHAFVAGPVTAPAATETALATSPSVPTPLEVNHVHVHFAFAFVTPTAPNFFTYNFYRGTSTSAPLAHAAPQLALSFTAADNSNASYDFAEDVVGMDNVQYTVTIKASAAAVTAMDVLIRVDVS